MKKKLLSDFDGVLTELKHEAHRVGEIFRSKLVGLSTLPSIEKWISENSEKVGWEFNGRITAYADEDAFIYNNGLAAELDRRALQDPSVQKQLTILQTQGFRDFKQVAQVSYEDMVKEVLASEESPADSEMRGVIEALLRNGHGVTVVSNSGTTRILDIFKKVDMKSHAHGSEGGELSVEVRGGAKKFELGVNPTWIQVGTRKIDVNRPVYEKILLEERPNLVIGDVFSLDLALPMHLAQTRKDSFPNGIDLILRQRPYTPKWVLDFMREKGTTTRTHLIESLEELPRFFQ